MSKANLKPHINQNTVDQAVQLMEQALQEIHGVIESLQNSVRQEDQKEILSETLEEAQNVLNRVFTEFQLLDRQLLSSLSTEDNHGKKVVLETKILDWFGQEKRFKTSA